MARYVDIDKLRFHGGTNCGLWVSYAEICDVIEDDAEWLRLDKFQTMWECSACHKWQTYGTPEYCMRCGRHMRSPDE